MAELNLKCDPEPFDALVSRIKTFEFRRDDRGYVVGDVLRLAWTGSDAWANFLVTYVLRGPAYGIPEGFVCMSVCRIMPEPHGTHDVDRLNDQTLCQECLLSVQDERIAEPCGGVPPGWEKDEV